MMKCKLCLVNDANQKGSHILSFFLIKSAFNEDGASGRRDKEIIYRMSPIAYAVDYFGRSVKPETIKNITGRDLTDEEVHSYNNSFTYDYILCSQCERNLGVLENDLARFYAKIDDSIVDKNDNKDYWLVSFENLNELTLRLFILTLVWRSSLVNFQNFKMLKKDEENLRKIIISCLGEDQLTIVKNCDENSERIKRYPLLLVYTGQGEPESNPVYLSIYNKPYFFILNNMMFFLYDKPNQLKGLHRPFLGVDKFIDVPFLAKKNESEFRIAYLKEEPWEHIKRNLIDILNDQLIRNIKEVFRKSYNIARGDVPDEATVEKMVSEYVLADKSTPHGERYSSDRILQILKKYI